MLLPEANLDRYRFPVNSASPADGSTPASLDAEAAAFDQRIEERKQAGYIPDLRRAVKCDYFYKSFWRDPHFVRLYLGFHLSVLQDFLNRFGRPQGRLLDVGCGPGYFSLEFARSGFDVTGIDISSKAITAARETFASSPRYDGFGSLRYEVQSLDDVQGEFDIITFTGVVHHFPEPDGVLLKAKSLLAPGGIVLCLEPCHERWREQDAAIVALIRGLLSATGHWYEPELSKSLLSSEAWAKYVTEIHTEYVTERDPHERGQSPNDNASSGAQILESLRRHFLELESRESVSFIYRLLGGLRGPDSLVHPIAELLTAFDHFGVERGHLQPNAFLWAGKKG